MQRRRSLVLIDSIPCAVLIRAPTLHDAKINYPIICMLLVYAVDLKYISPSG